MKIKINEKLPDSEVFQLINEEPVKIKIYSLFSKKKATTSGGLSNLYGVVCFKLLRNSQQQNHPSER